MWFIAVEVEQETSVPPPKKNPASAPEPPNVNHCKTQCWTLFVIAKATFSKTAIKPKFVDRFSLKNSTATIANI